MTGAELLARIRVLMTEDVLPAERPSIERRGITPDERNVAVTNPAPEPCTVCGEPGTQISLFFLAGHVVRLHAACEVLWQQERTTRPSR